MPKTPPKASMETSTPVFPNGRVGTIFNSDIMGEAPAYAVWVTALNGASTDPKPAAPADLKKSLLDKLVFLPDIPWRLLLVGKNLRVYEQC